MTPKHAYPFVFVLGAVFFLGCTPPKPVSNAFGKFRSEDPRSILVVPVVNRSVDVTAADCFLSTISRPVAERGYYVYPVYLVKRTLEEDGLADADLVHQADPKRLGAMFGADAILYVTIDRWDAKYAILATSVEVGFRYSMKSGKTGEQLWSSSEFLRYTPESQPAGSGLGGLIAMAVSAGVAKASPNYIPLAQQANGTALARIPAGPYAEGYRKDLAGF